MDLTALAGSRIRELLIRKEVRAEEVVRAHLARIEQEDKEVRAYLTLTPERALDQARKVDRQVAAGEPLGALAGVPMAVKDVILYRGVRTTCGSKILEHYTAPYDATAVARVES